MLDYEFWIADYVSAERSSAKEIVVSPACRQAGSLL